MGFWGLRACQAARGLGFSSGGLGFGVGMFPLILTVLDRDVNKDC